MQKSLPPLDEGVWAWVVGDCNGTWSTKDMHGAEMQLSFNSRTNHNAWLCNGERDCEYQVTHWMPLPLSPDMTIVKEQEDILLAHKIGESLERFLGGNPWQK